jgi:hypothetical protein
MWSRYNKDKHEDMDEQTKPLWCHCGSLLKGLSTSNMLADTAEVDEAESLTMVDRPGCCTP